MSDVREAEKHEKAEGVPDPRTGRVGRNSLPPGTTGRTGDGIRSGTRVNPALIWASIMRAIDLESRYGHGFLWFPIAMALGATIWFAADRDILLWPVALLFVVLAAGCYFLAGSPVWRYVCILGCGFLLGMLAAAVETHRHATTLLDGPVTTQIEGIVAARDIDDRGRWRYTVNLSSTQDPEIGRPPEQVRLLARSRHDPIGVGEAISGVARLQPPSGPALPGQYDFAFNAYYQGLGAFGFFYGRPEQLAADGSGGGVRAGVTIGMFLARIREQIAFRVRSVLPGDVGAFASALTVADRRSMSPAAVEALRASGLAHVLAISGLHMALVAGTVFFVLRTGFSLFPSFAQAFAVKKLAAAVSLIFATAYLLISGASVSTQRAWLMLAIVLIAVIVDRPALTLRNVALAAICIILLSPSAVVGPGFQMSFAATAALIAAYAAWRRRERAASANGVSNGSGIARVIIVFFVGLAATSLVAGLATAPFASFHFHRVASYGLIANLAAMPLVTLVVMPAGLVSVLAMPLGLEHWPLQLMGLGLEGVLSVAYSVQNLDGHLTTGRMTDEVFLLLTGGFLVLVLMRSWLRIIGLPIIAVALVMLVVRPKDSEPELLISEDGRLVALVGGNILASNRSRPSKFIFDQWKRALRRDEHVRPEKIDSVQEGSAIAASEWNATKPNETVDPSFRCLKNTICLGSTVSGIVVSVVDDLTLLGTACDRSDIVITSRAIQMSKCRSGALLITGRMLRQTGAVEIYGATAGQKPRIATAIGQSNRPWTAHRSYDWRSRSFAFHRPDWAKQ